MDHERLTYEHFTLYCSGGGGGLSIERKGVACSLPSLSLIDFHENHSYIIVHTLHPVIVIPHCSRHTHVCVQDTIISKQLDGIEGQNDN